MSDVRSVTGSNLRSILNTTGTQVVPGITKAASIKNHKLHKLPEDETWKVPLLHSLLAVKSGVFEIQFDDETEDSEVMDIGSDILGDICCR